MFQYYRSGMDAKEPVVPQSTTTKRGRPKKSSCGNNNSSAQIEKPVKKT
jgi:hypothetical protein